MHAQTGLHCTIVHYECNLCKKDSGEAITKIYTVIKACVTVQEDVNLTDLPAGIYSK